MGHLDTMTGIGQWYYLAATELATEHLIALVVTVKLLPRIELRDTFPRT